MALRVLFTIISSLIIVVAFGFSTENEINNSSSERVYYSLGAEDWLSALLFDKQLFVNWKSVGSLDVNLSRVPTGYTTQIVYINIVNVLGDYRTLSNLKDIVKLLHSQGAVIIINAESLSHDDRVNFNDFLYETLGIALNSPIIISYKDEMFQKMTIYSFSEELGNEKHALFNQYDKVAEQIEIALTNLLDLKINNSSNSVLEHDDKKKYSIGDQYFSNKYLSFYKEYNLYFIDNNIPCNMMKSYGSSELYDYCNNNASVDLNMTVTLFGSETSSSNTTIEDFMNLINPEDDENTTYLTVTSGKYVRIALSDGNSGNGIHIGDLQQTEYEHSDNVDRKVSIGPFAESYAIDINSVAGIEPVIINALPNNQPAFFSHMEKTVLSFKPKLNIKPFSSGKTLDVNQFFKDKKQLSWDNLEYSVDNKTVNSNFRVQWNRVFDECEELTFRNKSCYFTDTLWSSYPVFNTEKFSAMSYGNFVPNFDVIYKVPLSISGTTDFNVKVDIVPKVRFGEIFNVVGLYSVFKPIGEDKTHIQLNKSFSVDWNSPFFKGIIFFKLQSLFADNLCLLSSYSEEKVTAELDQCSQQNKYVFYIDAEDRIRNLYFDDYCLSLSESNDHVDFKKCDLGLNQKWTLTDFRLTSLKNYNRFSVIPFGKKLKVIPTKEVEDNKLEAWKIDFINY